MEMRIVSMKIWHKKPAMGFWIQQGAGQGGKRRRRRERLTCFER
jgi:hypothetical protein